MMRYISRARVADPATAITDSAWAGKIVPVEVLLYTDH